MNAAHAIRDAVAQVERLRQESRTIPEIGTAVVRVKRFQARRFAGSYADLLAGGPYAAGVRFFLDELYSERDAGERDAQFARIAAAVEKLFPREVADTAVGLARLHALTESLDHAMARSLAMQSEHDLTGYVRAWQCVGRREDRERQLETVVAIGTELARLTRLPGLRMMLRMMRGPAAATGMASLQRFLETGFDTFGDITRFPGGAERFLATVRQREQALLALLFAPEAVACETELSRILARAP